MPAIVVSYSDLFSWLCNNLQNKTTEALLENDAVIMTADRFHKEREDVIAELRAATGTGEDGLVRVEGTP